MARVMPLAAVRYAAVRDLPGLLAPPYDVINDRELARLNRLAPHNITHLTLGSSLRKRSYREISRRFRKWLDDGVMVQDPRRAFYAYCQDYLFDGHPLRFWGLLGLLKLEPFGAGNIYPHEAVLPEPVEDRMRVMEHARANLEPIMTLYRQISDPMDMLFESLEGLPPLISATFPGGNRHRVWRLPLSQTCARIQRNLRGLKLFVADGHHRYHAAWMFRQRHRRLSGADWILSLVANTEQKGMRINPIHRYFTCAQVITADLPRSLATFGRIERLGSRARAVMEPGRNAIGFYARGTGAWFLHLPPLPERLKPRETLEVVRLHELIPQVARVADVKFPKDPEEAAAAARRSPSVLAVFLPPISSHLITSIAFGGETLPQKSTFFLPKPASGLVLRLIE